MSIEIHGKYILGRLLLSVHASLGKRYDLTLRLPELQESADSLTLPEHQKGLVGYEMIERSSTVTKSLKFSNGTIIKEDVAKKPEAISF